MISWKPRSFKNDCFHLFFSALPEVRCAHLWRRRWIWNFHPWLPSLQKEDRHVSKIVILPCVFKPSYFMSHLAATSSERSYFACRDAAETVIHSADAFAPVGYLRFTAMHTESKDNVSETFVRLNLQSKSILLSHEMISFTRKVWLSLGWIIIKLLWGVRQK